MTTQTFYQPGFMDLTAYSLERAPADADWDRLVESSPQGSVFALSAFTGTLAGANPGLFFVKKGQQTMAELLVFESEDGRSCVTHDLVVYNGLMLQSPPTNQSAAQTTSEDFRITTSVVSQLVERYDEVHLTTHPALSDIRPFLWHNYGEDGPKFEVDVRFTSTLGLNQINPDGPIDANPIYMSSSKSRRQEIRYGLRKGVQTVSEPDPDLFIDLYRSTFDRQQLLVDAGQTEELRAVIESLLNAGNARMYVSRTAEGEVGSTAVFGTDSKRAYYLFGANNPELRDQHTGTAVMWEGILDLARDGYPELDLEGINSPARGHFKLSFGGEIVPYFRISLKAGS